MGLEKRVILIVDDQKSNIDLLDGALRDDYTLLSTLNGAEAIELARQNNPDLILLDIMMPDMDGWEVCEAIKSDPLTEHIPIIFISALDELSDKIRAFSSGAVDYITKPFYKKEVKARINAHLSLQVAMQRLEYKTLKYQELYRKLSESQRKLKESQQELIQSAKMASLGVLSAGIAHEINNGITVIDRSFDAVVENNTEFINVYKDLLDVLSPEIRDKVTEIASGLVASAQSHLPIDTNIIRENGSKIKHMLKSQAVELSIMESKKLASCGFNEQNIHEIYDILKSGRTKLIIKFLYINYSLGNALQDVAIGKNRIKSIVSAIKEYVYPGEAEKNQIDVNLTIDKVLRLLENQTKYGIEVVKNYQPQLPKLVFKEEQFYEIITNIINNAVQAMSGAGKITIDTDTRFSDGEWYISVRLADTGPGIPDDIKDKLFEPFFTTKRVGEGTGLGLWIVNKTMRGYNGKLLAYNSNEGAVFELLFNMEETTQKLSDESA